MYYWENRQKLDIEFADPAAFLVLGDTAEDARDRAASNGVCLRDCRFLPTERRFVWSHQIMRTLKICEEDRVTSRRVDACDDCRPAEYTVKAVD